MSIPNKFTQLNITGDIKDYISSIEQFLSITGDRVESLQSSIYQREQEAKIRAEQLLKQKEILINIFDPYKYSRFDELGEISLDNGITGKAIKAAQILINELNVCRNWLESYKELADMIHELNIGNLHDELLILGKSILGRAIELCPYKIGALRDSGRLYDFGEYIVISFNASYASYVHEIMEYHHDNGQAKFLEQAAQEFFPNDTVWVNVEGYDGVKIVISINPLYVSYMHYGEGG